MINELKTIMSTKYDNELKNLSEAYNKIRFYRDRTETYVYPYTNTTHLSDVDDMDERIAKYMESYKNKTLFDRISSHADYKKTLKSMQIKLEALKEEIRSLSKPKYYDNQKQLTSMINELKKKIESTENANTLGQLGLSLDEAFKLLESNGRTLCLTDEDKEAARVETEYYYDNKKYTALAELILVHKTAFAPSNDVIKSNINSSAFFERTFVLDKTTKACRIKDFRNTIHFCLNGEVTSHAYGNFDNRKYAILQPLTEELAGKIKGFNPSDTYFEGKVNLDRAYILCPIEEKETVSNNNPKSIVVPYKGETVDKFADTLITLLGYQCEKVGMWNWQNETAELKRIDSSLIDKYKWTYIQHSVSVDKDIENDLYTNDRFVRFLDFVFEAMKSQNLNPYDVYTKFPSLVRENDVYIHHNNTHGKAESFKKIDDVFNKSNLGNVDIEELMKVLSYEGANQDVYKFWQGLIKHDVSYYNSNNRYTGYGLSDLYTKMLYLKRLLGSDFMNYPVGNLIEAQKYEQEKDIENKRAK